MRLPQTTGRAAAASTLQACQAAMTVAHLHPGGHSILQSGVQVGEVYVPQRTTDCQYVEHWILYPHYVYPSAMNQAATEIVPASNLCYASEADFFARAPFGPGYRYIHVISTTPLTAKASRKRRRISL